MGIKDFLRRFGFRVSQQKAQHSKVGGQSAAKHKSPEGVCPYCGVVLDSAPKRKANCQQCGRFIYVRTKQDVFDSQLLTEVDAISADYLKKLDYLGINSGHYHNKRNSLAEKFGTNPSSRDVMWGLYNDLIVNNIRDYFTLKQLYFAMAHFQEDLGENFADTLRLARKMELYHYREGGVDKVAVLSTNCCPECAALHHKVFSVADALNEMPLPCHSCISESRQGGKRFCLCVYGPYIEDLNK
jgi:hypothetical protein